METIATTEKVRILFLASDPSENTKLNLGKELMEVRKKLEKKPAFDIRDQWAVKPEDVLSTISEYKPHIVHFSGHGDNSGELVFEDEIGNSKVVPPGVLADIFSLTTDFVKCVIVNACYSEKQAKAIAKYVPVVIGTKAEIIDNDAIKFSSGFYTNLDPDLSQKNLEKAFRTGRINIQLDGNLDEGLAPILLLGSPEVLFSAEVDAAFLTISKPKGLAVEILKKGLLLTGKKMGVTEDMATRIIEDKIQKLRSYNESILEYENSLKDILRDEFPLSDSSLAALLQLQKGLSLNEDDVNVQAVKKRILSDPKLDSAYSWFDRGRGQFDLGNFEKALVYYSNAIEKNQEYSGAYYERGYAHEKTQEFDKAIDDYTKAIDYNKNWEIASSLSLAYFNRGLANYSKQPQNKENMINASKDWTQSIDLNPNDPNAYWNRGLANQFLGNFEKAIVDYKKWFEIDTTSSNKVKASRVANIVRCYQQLNKPEEVEKWGKVGLDLLGKKVEM